MADREQPYDPYVPSGQHGGGNAGQGGNQRTAQLQAVGYCSIYSDSIFGARLALYYEEAFSRTFSVSPHLRLVEPVQRPSFERWRIGSLRLSHCVHICRMATAYGFYKNHAH